MGQAINTYIRPALILLVMFTLASCASVNGPLQSRIQTGSNIIDIAAVEVDDQLKIRRLNGVFALMGSSGLVVENAFMVTQREEYQSKAGEVGKQAIELFKASLLSQLKKSGYHVRDSGIPYWDYFKGKMAKLRQTSGGLLRIQLKQVGFWSSGFQSPYVPSVIAIAEMIDPRSRKVLYRDRFAIGFKDNEQKILSAYYGEMKVVSHSDKAPQYENFRDLLAAPDESRQQLLQTMETASSIIVEGLGRPAPRFLAAEEAKPSTPNIKNIPSFKNSL